jgi:endonuclease/exonuclease/phosphatase family metal-dependent hydrolase
LWWLVLVAIVIVALRWCGGRSLVLGTFNIRTFPGTKTDPEAVARALAELDADAIAVQEIADVAAFERVLARASELSGRRYAAVFAAYCRKRTGGVRMNIGVVYDEARLEQVGKREFGGDMCPLGQPPGLLALLRGGRETIGLVSVHLDALDHEKAHAERRRQWAWMVEQVPALTREFAAPIVIAGDLNSTGFLVPGHAERVFIDETVAQHRLQLPTRVLACSEYWQRSRKAPYEVSLLDHVLASDELSFGPAEVLGMCAALACEPQDSAPDGFHTVSDHCPVRIELR